MDEAEARKFILESTPAMWQRMENNHLRSEVIPGVQFFMTEQGFTFADQRTTNGYWHDTETRRKYDELTDA